MLVRELFEAFKAGTLPSLLLEAAANRYKPMFQAVIAVNPNAEKIAMEEIQWALKTLKKDDRVVWYLRLAQVVMLAKHVNQFPQLQKPLAKKSRDVAKAMGRQMSDDDVANIAAQVLKNNFKENVAHYLTLPIPAIVNHKFGAESPEQLLQMFNVQEEEWKADQSRVIDDGEEEEVVLDFKDGYRWYNLNRAYCSREAAAMGHCGNSPRQSSDDTILSLRRDVRYGEDVKHTPVLTFILKSDGYLSEMKGRNNDKPAARYHKYIVPLLKLDIIEGIVGGGYLPEHNFSIEDLDEETKDELLEAKPELAGPMHQVNAAIEAGDFKKAVELTKEILYDQDYPHDEFVAVHEMSKNDWHYTRIRLASWDTFEEFAEFVGDRTVQHIYEVIEEVNDKATDMGPWFEDNPDWYATWLTDNGYGKFADKKQGHLFIDDDVDVPSENEVKEKITDEKGGDMDELLGILKKRASLYAELGYNADMVWEMEFGPEDSDDPLDQIVMEMAFGTILDILNSNGDYEDEYGYQGQAWKEHVDPSYNINMDWESINERRREEDLAETEEPDDVAMEIWHKMNPDEDDE